MTLEWIYTGLRAFVVSAVFVVGWLMFLIIAGLMARLLGGKESGDDDE